MEAENGDATHQILVGINFIFATCFFNLSFFVYQKTTSFLMFWLGTSHILELEFGIASPWFNVPYDTYLASFTIDHVICASFFSQQ